MEGRRCADWARYQPGSGAAGTPRQSQCHWQAPARAAPGPLAPPQPSHTHTHTHTHAHARSAGRAEDLRGLLRATTLPKKRVKHIGSVVRRKTVTPTPPPPALPAAALAGDPDNSGSEPGSARGGSTPAAGSGRGPAFDAPAQRSDDEQQRLQRGSSDAVIAVPGDRSPPRERPVQPGSELHRQLSDPAVLAAAAARQQRPEPQA